jgi:tetratricopeptide (TPR) repeat protein
MIDIADKAGIKHIKIRNMRLLASYYWHDIKNYELAFEQFLLMEKELNDVSETEYPDMAKELLMIGDAYYYFQEIDLAKKYLSRAALIKETAFNSSVVTSAKNTLALCYRKEGDLDKADFYFNEVLKTPFEATRKEWEGIIKGNLGVNYYMRKAYDEAVPLLQFSYQEAQNYRDYAAAADAQTTLADIFLQKTI